MSLVVTRNLSKDYRMGKTRVAALRDINLEVGESEFLAIVGPSGSGKTTLLNLIGCLDTPTSGEVWLEGERLDRLQSDQLAEIRSEKLSFIFQAFNLIPVLTAAENIEYPLLFQQQRLRSEKRRKKVEQVLERLSIGAFAGHRPDQLSGGQRQKVAIARALITRPRMILADEPTANLDTRSGEEIIRLMRELHESRGTTFIFSTHDQRIVAMARRVVELCDGRQQQPSRQSTFSEVHGTPLAQVSNLRR